MSAQRSRKCRHCGELFTPDRKGQVYDTSACKQAAYRQRWQKTHKPVPRDCEYCGEALPADQPRLHYCPNGRCKQAAYRQRHYTPPKR